MPGSRALLTDPVQSTGLQGHTLQASRTHLVRKTDCDADPTSCLYDPCRARLFSFGYSAWAGDHATARAGDPGRPQTASEAANQTINGNRYRGVPYRDPDCFRGNCNAERHAGNCILNGDARRAPTPTGGDGTLRHNRQRTAGSSHDAFHSNCLHSNRLYGSRDSRDDDA